MDHNEITMFMDTKVDLQDKRAESAFFRHWNRCQVRIEAIKCLPCFLRINLECRMEDKNLRAQTDEQQKAKNLTISINVPGVTITLASSRTKQHSYAVSWMQNRRCCYIYFALETELSCRRHMKWLRKSIKNLELHRKIMLEDRRTSRVGVDGAAGGKDGNNALGPLPLLPSGGFHFDESSCSWSQRVSEIYEEILEGNHNHNHQDSQQRLSRRCSSTSIASGIYEEMKIPYNVSNNFDCINEEMPSNVPSTPTPPPLPPLPSIQQRKRFNTYKAEENAATPISSSNEIQRSNTNPETEMAKKKKYKNVLENFFYVGALRSKRTISVNSDSSSKEQIFDNTETTPKAKEINKAESAFMSPTHSHAHAHALPSPPIYANDDAIIAKRHKKPYRIDEGLEKCCSKRNSFSSPDLSKINFVDTFDEQRIAEILGNSYSKHEEYDLANCASLDEINLTGMQQSATSNVVRATLRHINEDKNISQQIPNNFNFSACNTSAINLIASLSAQPSQPSQKKQTLQKSSYHHKNKIIFDDLSGYCVMAPIVKKMSAIDNTPLPIIKIQNSASQLPPVESISSGYSTGSHCSSTTSSSCTNSAEEQNPSKPEENQSKAIQEESVVYENMDGGLDAIVPMLMPLPIPPPLPPPIQSLNHTSSTFFDVEFTGNLYENLLAIKAAQELEQIPIKNSSRISTSTPADSPLLEQAILTPSNCTPNVEEEENYYQTPRKSIISIDEKVPSYYPNTCEASVKSRRRSYSPARVNNKNLEKTPTSSRSEKSSSLLTTTPVARNFMSSYKNNIERKENIYLTAKSPRKSKSNTTSISPNINASTKMSKSKKTAAHKISENVYAVTHCLKKSITVTTPQSNNNNIEKNENQNMEAAKAQPTEQCDDHELLHLSVLQNIDFKFESSNEDAEMKSQKTLRRNTSPIAKNIQNHNSPAIRSIIKTTQTMSQSTTIAPTNNENENVGTGENHLAAGIKKFASLPRFKKFNLSPLRTRISNALQRNHTPDL